MIGIGVLILALMFAVFGQLPGGPDARVAQVDTFLRLRQLPTTQSEILAELETGTPLTVTARSESGDWLAVITPDERAGWVARQYVDVRININSLPVSNGYTVIIPTPRINADTAAHIREIYARGQQLGRRANAFAKVGDSISAAPHMLTPIAEGHYELGEFSELQRVIDHFVADAFAAQSKAAVSGWTSGEVLRPELADPKMCEEGETPLACEYRLTNPAVALIMYGTNDVALINLAAYEANMQAIIDYTVQQGIIPVISTIPMREGYTDQVTAFNRKIRELAERNRIPLWQYGAVMQTLPENGLTGDGVHPSLPYRGYDGVADFRADNLYSGYVVRNLGALMMLNALLDVIG